MKQKPAVEQILEALANPSRVGVPTGLTRKEIDLRGSSELYLLGSCFPTSPPIVKLAGQYFTK